MLLGYLRALMPRAGLQRPQVERPPTTAPRRRCRGSHLSRFPELWSKDTAERSPRLAQSSCNRRLAGRGTAMAPYLHVDLHRDGPGVQRLPDLQRQLQAGALRAA